LVQLVVWRPAESTRWQAAYGTMTAAFESHPRAIAPATPNHSQDRGRIRYSAAGPSSGFASSMFKTFSLSLLFVLALGLMIAAYSTIPI